MWVVYINVSDYGVYGKVAIRIHNEVVFMIICNKTVSKIQATEILRDCK